MGKLTNVELLHEVMDETMKIWDKYKLQEGDVVTLLAYLQQYIQWKMQKGYSVG